MTFEPEHATIIIIYLTLIAATVASLSIALHKTAKIRWSPLIYPCGLLIYALTILILPFWLTDKPFERVNLLAYAVFVGGPLILLCIQTIARQSGHKIAANVYCLLALLVVAISIDAFLIEPHWLETTYLTLNAPKIKNPIKIAVLSDIQIDHTGDYERSTLEKIMAEKPDLILMPGDYVQCLSATKQKEEETRFTKLIKETGLNAPLGIYAVRGNVEIDSWRDMFKGTAVQAFEHTTSHDCGDLVVTALSFDDSFNTAVKIARQDKLQIIFGHGPDFALAHPPAELLIAGHTHGGQVRLPGIGPLITLSKVPKSWAAGMTEIGPGSTLVVSRGVGHEKGYAPRLRFLCRPQLVFITLKPGA